MYNDVPDLDDDPMWNYERTILTSVGMTTDEDTLNSRTAESPYSRLAAAATTREPDADISWAVVAGYDVTPHAKGTGDDDNASHDSDDWHPDDEFEELDPEGPILEYVRGGNFSRCVTTCKTVLLGPACFGE